MNDLMFRIQKHYAQLTPSSRKIADYLQASGSQAQYYSISELALACGVAEATVFRFCRSLGFDGYNDFKLTLAKSLVQGESSASPRAMLGQPTDEDTVSAMAHRLYASNLEALDETLARLNEDALVQAGRLLQQANKVFCLGSGGSMVSAMEAWNRFSCISGKFFTIQDSHAQLMAASLLNEADVVLYISLSGSSVEAGDLLQTAKKRGAKIILLTHRAGSISSALADVTLLCGGPESTVQLSSISSQMGVLFEIDLLVNEFCRHNRDSVLVNRDLTRTALAAKHL